jgi:hypothetical protein
VGGDGTLYLATTGHSLQVIAPDGATVVGSGDAVWSGLATAPDGTVYVWGSDPDPADVSVVLRSRVAALDSDGRPRPGWPVTLPGSISAPVFGPDGTAYVSSNSNVVALGPDGRTRSGWPVGLGATAHSVVVDAGSGRVYVTAVDSHGSGSLTAFDPSGVAVPGSPVPLLASPAGFVDTPDSSAPPLVVTRPTGQTRIYVALKDEIEAIDEDESGWVVRGWLFMMPGSDFARWVGMWPTPDGGLVVESASSSLPNGVSLYRLIRFNSDGGIVK